MSFIPDNLQTITLANAPAVKELAQIGQGVPRQTAWSADQKTFIIATPAGVWLYDTADLNAPPRLLPQPATGFRLAAGKLAVIGSHQVTVWDLATDTADNTFAFTDKATAIALAPDASHLAIAENAANGSTLSFWQTQTAQPAFTLSLPQTSVTDMVFSPNGRYLATATTDDGVYLWDVPSQSRHHTFTHPGRLSCAAFSPDGRYLASASRDEHTIHLWQIDTGELTAVIHTTTQWQGQPSSTYARSLAFSPDGTKLAAVTVTATPGSEITLYDTQKGETTLVLPFAGATVAFHPDGRYLASGRWIWQAETGEKHFVFDAHDQITDELAFDPDDQFLVMGRRTSTPHLQRLDVTTGTRTTIIYKPMSTYPPDTARLFTFSPQGQFLATWDDHTVYLRALHSDKHSTFSLHQPDAALQDITFSPDDTLLAACSDTHLWVWDTHTHTELATFAVEARQIAFHPAQDKTIAIRGDEQAWLLHIPTGKKQAIWERNEAYQQLHYLTFSPDGQWLAIAAVVGENVPDLQQGLWLWQTASDTWQQHLLGPGQPVTMMRQGFTSDGRFLVGTSEYLTAVCTIDTGSHTILAQRQPIRITADYASDTDDPPVDPWTVTESVPDSQSFVWKMSQDRSQGKVTLTGWPQQERVSAIQLHPQHPLLAVGYQNGRLQLWNLETGTTLWQSDQHTHAINDLAFNQSGTLLATADQAGIIRLWGI